ncbi:MAG: UPF0280 family protein [Thermoplasmata archaeon]|jgi:hypothetical protein|nr:UPF0280 family protein [Thermoplasmata archaeon]
MFVHSKVEIGETAATVACDRRFLGPAVDAIKAARAEVERQVRRDPFFLATMEPYPCDGDAGRTVRRMCEAAGKAHVGPMAAVAGAIAQEALEAMAAAGCTHGWVDNGGDIALLLEEPATVEVFCEPGAKEAFGFEMPPAGSMVGVCSSSGRLGHSISLGDADVAVAFADDAVLADALATAIGNRVVDSESMQSCFEPFKGIRGFRGGLALRDGEVAMWGELPRLVEVEHSPERVTVHSRMAGPAFTGDPTHQGVRI